MTENIFENAKKFHSNGDEFWSARDLQQILGYQKWGNFVRVIEKAQMACEIAGNLISDHFAEVGKMVSIGSGAMREQQDFQLSRYACYLIVQNGDPSKPVIANGQTYFAVQTRRQEIADDQAFSELSEERQRLYLRQQLRAHNSDLASAADQAGVSTSQDYAIFQNHGYKGLYGGLDNKAIHAKKGLKKSQKILDHMNASELAANLFRATQTEEKLRRDNIKGKQQANKTHFEVGQVVRKTIEQLGGVMPEDQPTPEKSIQQIEREQKKLTSTTTKLTKKSDEKK